MDIQSLEAEATRLVLSRFDEETALRLGLILLELAKGKPVVINIRNAHRTFFHAALPGSRANNDNWARRKGNTALMHGAASMYVTLRYAERKRTLQTDGLTEADYALSGGAVPICITGTGMVAIATISGLPEQEDHALVVAGIMELMTRLT